jgi:hypothetical protein
MVETGPVLIAADQVAGIVAGVGIEPGSRCGVESTPCIDSGSDTSIVAIGES